MGTEDKQMRKERNLRYQMRKKGYQFNREQRVVVLPENGKNRSAVQENGFGYWDMIFSTICFKQIKYEYRRSNKSHERRNQINP